VHQFVTKPIRTKSICSGLRQVIIRLYISFGVDASRLLFVDHAGSSSRAHRTVVIIADNHLHHQHRNIVAAVTTHGQRQTPTRSSSPTSDAVQLQVKIWV
jgi:hypothetical protein